MENMSEYEITNSNGDSLTYVLIDRGNGEFTSMPKTLWEELEAQRELGGTL